MDPSPRIARLQHYLANWGVSLVWYDADKNNLQTHLGPGCADLNLATQTVFVSTRYANCPIKVVGNCLHELSHLLTPEDPDEADEMYGPILALDWAHHRNLGEEEAYQAMMATFQVDPAAHILGHYPFKGWWEWPDLSYPDQVKFLNASHVKAAHLGLVSHWRPTFKRGSSTIERLREVFPEDA